MTAKTNILQDFLNLQEDVKKKIHPPNKKLYDQRYETITNKIADVDAKLKPKSKTQPCDSSLKKLQEEIINKIGRRKKMDEECRILCDKISRKGDELSKKLASLPARTVERLEGQIRTLHYQLDRNNYNVRDETRIVHEIDRHKRSMKTLREYLAEKEELDGEKTKKSKLKTESYKLYREISNLKSKEDKLKKQHNEIRSQTSLEWTALKKELDELYNQRRQLSVNYQTEQSQFYEQRKERNERQKQHQRDARKREVRETIELRPEPYADKLKSCNMLLNYLQRYTNDIQDMTANQLPTASASGHGLSPSSSVKEDGGLVCFRKKYEDDDFYPGNNTRKKKHGKMRIRKFSWLHKSISHPPDIFLQFTELGLVAPSSAGDVIEVIAQLTKVKLSYDPLSNMCASKPGTDSGVASTSESVCYSPGVTDTEPSFPKSDGSNTTNSSQLADNDSVFGDSSDTSYTVDDEDLDLQSEGEDQKKPHLQLNIISHNETNHALPPPTSSTDESKGTVNEQLCVTDHLTSPSTPCNNTGMPILPDNSMLNPDNMDLVNSFSSLASNLCHIDDEKTIHKLKPVVSERQVHHLSTVTDSVAV